MRNATFLFELLYGTFSLYFRSRGTLLRAWTDGGSRSPRGYSPSIEISKSKSATEKLIELVKACLVNTFIRYFNV